MKKFLIALTMVMGATNAHAFDIKFNTAGTNGDILGQMIVQQIVKQIVPTGVIQNGNVHSIQKCSQSFSSETVLH